MKSKPSITEPGAAAPAAAATPAPGRVLKSPGIPWVVQVDGDDLVVRNILATCFGGMFDSGDNGDTESGVPNHHYPIAGTYPMGVALPIRNVEAATRNSPLAFKGPHIPWLTTVRVWRESDGEKTGLNCILIDNGPDVSNYPSHALDLNPNAALCFAPTYDPKKIADDWSGDGFSYRIMGGANYIS